ncbi:MAG: cation:proton antiporter [Verrucomicrobiota bacterium]|nr:cation:proton antiporter [Verrucomicrobiota bacterium]
MEPNDLTFLLDLGFIVVTAAAFSLLGKLIKMPSIVAYIIAGIFLGPCLRIVELSHSLELISELGIGLLLFLVGIELSFKKIKDLGQAALILGGLQILLTSITGFALAKFMGFEPMEAFFLAATVTFSSTVVVIKLLDQKGATNRLFGRIAISLFLAQDIVIILAMTLLSGLGKSQGFEVAELGVGIAIAVAGMVALLFISLLASRYILPRPFKWAAQSSDTVFIWALCWCFLMVLLAHQFHLSVEIGAFLAGIAIAQLPIHEDLHRRLHPLMTFFIAVFLVTLGVKTDIAILSEIWPYLLGLSVFVIIVKPLIVFLILSRLNYSEYTSFQAATASGQVSEFAFILLSLAATVGLIEDTIVSLGALVGILTIAISSYLIIYSESLYAFIKSYKLLEIFNAKKTADVELQHSYVGHIIVVGMNALGREIAKQLAIRGEQVLAIDTDPRKLEYLEGADTLIGNVEYESMIEEIGLRRARLVISALQIEDTNHLLAYRCRSAEVPCAIHAFDLSVIDDLLELDTAYMFMPAVDAVRTQLMLFDKIPPSSQGKEMGAI